MTKFNNRGFSFIEIIISLAIISFSLLALMKQQWFAVQQLQELEEKSRLLHDFYHTKDQDIDESSVWLFTA